MSLASRADCLIANSVIFMRNSIDKCITTVRRKEIMLKKKKENRVKRQKYPLFFNRIWFFFLEKKQNNYRKSFKSISSKKKKKIIQIYIYIYIYILKGIIRPGGLFRFNLSIPNFQYLPSALGTRIFHYHLFLIQDRISTLT